MKSISEAIGIHLEWREPKVGEKYFELRTEEEIFGTLEFRSMFGTLATAETDQGKWTFKRVGFLKPRVTVRENGSEKDIAVYQPKIRGDGTLTFPDGVVFGWKPKNFWSTEWAFYDIIDRMFVTFKPGTEKTKLSDLFKVQAIVEVSSEAATCGRLSLLLTLGWYLIILHRQDTATTAAIT